MVKLYFENYTTKNNKERSSKRNTMITAIKEELKIMI